MTPREKLVVARPDISLNVGDSSLEALRNPYKRKLKKSSVIIELKNFLW
jgi:hypothetical protein